MTTVIMQTKPERKLSERLVEFAGLGTMLIMCLVSLFAVRAAGFDLLFGVFGLLALWFAYLLADKALEFRRKHPETGVRRFSTNFIGAIFILSLGSVLFWFTLNNAYIAPLDLAGTVLTAVFMSTAFVAITDALLVESKPRPYRESDNIPEAKRKHWRERFPAGTPLQHARRVTFRKRIVSFTFLMLMSAVFFSFAVELLLAFAPPNVEGNGQIAMRIFFGAPVVMMGILSLIGIVENFNKCFKTDDDRAALLFGIGDLQLQYIKAMRADPAYSRFVVQLMVEELDFPLKHLARLFKLPTVIMYGWRVTDTKTLWMRRCTTEFRAFLEAEHFLANEAKHKGKRKNAFMAWLQREYGVGNVEELEAQGFTVQETPDRIYVYPPGYNPDLDIRLPKDDQPTD